MSKKEILYNLLEKQKGLITTADLKKEGVEREYLRVLESEGDIEKVERGVYINVNVFEDQLFNKQYRFKRGIYSHLTALYLHNLTDRTPFQHTMTFPRKYNTTNAKKHSIETYRIDEKYYSVGTTEVTTTNGNKVTVYTKERTLCDILKKNSRVSKEIVIKAYQRYAKEKNKNISELYRIAKMLKVYEQVKNYIEVLI